jgi:hypothetical protein
MENGKYCKSAPQPGKSTFLNQDACSQPRLPGLDQWKAPMVQSATLFIKRWLEIGGYRLHFTGEFFAAREIRYTPRKTTPPPHPTTFSLACRRFCGPL